MHTGASIRFHRAMATADRTSASRFPPDAEIVVRRVGFQFPDDLAPLWNARQPEWSHMVNGMSLTMPYLEPFLIRSVAAVIDQISDEQVRAAAQAFVAQEAQHFQTHRRYNELLKRNGYPQLADVESAMQKSYERIERKRSLKFRLAYTSGFEVMTPDVTRWLCDERRKLFAGSDTRVASFILWHFVEEAEHKNVAFDVYRSVYGGYVYRVIGGVYAPLHLIWYTRRGTVAMLKQDGRWWSPRARIRAWMRLASFLGVVVPGILRGFRPGHDPRDIEDPQWAKDWIAGWAAGPPSKEPPLLDTSHPDVPVPFPSPH